MSEVFLRYGGLKPDQRSWYLNRRGAPVEIRPGEWVRLDSDKHPEVLPAIQVGTATVEQSAPADVEVLDENTYANREANPYGKILPQPRPPRKRSPGSPQVLELSVDQLEEVARCFLPWPGWQEDLDRSGQSSEDRFHHRGSRPSVSLPIVFDANFVVLHRIAELIERRRLQERKTVRRNQIEAGWASGEYQSKSECRKYYERAHPLPPKNWVLVGLLRRWGIWSRSNVPSPKTLKRYRSMLGADCPVRAFVDEQILEVSRKKCQRIILSASALMVGSYVPGHAASPALTVLRPVGPITIDFTV